MCSEIAVAIGVEFEYRIGCYPISLPSKVNLTIPATLLHSLAPQTGDWAFTSGDGTGLSGDEGQWTTPAGRTYVQEPKRYPA